MKDLDVRRALIRSIRTEHFGQPDTLILEEVGICQGTARVDVAVVNGTFHGYEIKSARDTLVRLEGQVAIYSKALEFVTIVAATPHLPAILAGGVPLWWGISTAAMLRDGSVALTPVRKALRNSAVETDALVQFLWREEALELLIEHDLQRGIASRSRQELWDRLTLNFNADQLGEMVRSRLKQRPSSWKAPLSQA